MRSNPQVHVAVRRSVTKYLAEAHMAPTLAVPVAVALAVVACLQGCDSREQAPESLAAPPLLYITLQAASVGAGGEPVTFTALLRGASGTIAWALDPAGVGALSTASGVVVAFRPPAEVAAPTTVRLIASAAGMSGSAAITVSPRSPPPGASITVTPGTACLRAGAGPTTFVAHLESVHGGITWSLDPPDAGTLSATTGASVAYTPPVVTPGPAFVVITARCAEASRSATVTIVPEPPGATPVVATLSPSRTVAGGPGLALTVEGTGFAPGSVVRWNGADRDTTYIGCTRVLASIPQEDLAHAGAQQVSVVNPEEVSSNARAFVIDHRLVARVSVATNGTAANHISYPNVGFRPATSADGRFVVFTSWASNLVPGDVHQNAEIFLRDTCFGAQSGCVPSTERVSVVGQNLLHNDEPTITPDGRYVAFVHLGATGSQGGVYVRDTCRGAPPGCSASTEYVSLSADGWTPVPSWEYAFWGWSPAISADGRFVAFYSEWSLVPEDAPATGGDAYVRDTCRGAPPGCTPATALVSLRPGGAAGGLDEVANSVGISADGRFVSFVARASGIVPEDTNGEPDLFVRDTCHGAPSGCVPSTGRVSVANDGAEGNGPTHHGSMGSTGRFVAFASEASNLVPGDANGLLDAFVRDTCRGAPPGCAPSTELVSLASDGSQGDGRSAFPQTSADAWSPDGTRIAYARRECRDGPGGRVCDPWDIYVRLPDGTAEPVALGSALADALDPAWSPDGKKIAYSYRLRDSAIEPHDHLSALAVVRVDGTGPDLTDPLRDEFIYGIGERPAWRR